MILLFYFRVVLVSSHSIAHLVEFDRCQILPFCISLCFVLSLLSAVLCFIKPKIQMARNRVKDLPNSISVERNDKILIEGYRNMRDAQGEMGSISLTISGGNQGIFSRNTSGNPCIVVF